MQEEVFRVETKSIENTEEGDDANGDGAGDDVEDEEENAAGDDEGETTDEE